MSLNQTNLAKGPTSYKAWGAPTVPGWGLRPWRLQLPCLSPGRDVGLPLGKGRKSGQVVGLELAQTHRNSNCTSKWSISQL